MQYQTVTKYDKTIHMRPAEVSKHILYNLGVNVQPFQISAWEDDGLIVGVLRGNRKVRLYTKSVVGRITTIAALKSIGIDNNIILEYLDDPNPYINDVIKTTLMAYSDRIMPYIADLV